MKTITTEENQTIYDVAVQYYGTAAAIVEILQLNPEIENDLKGYSAAPDEFITDLPIKAGSRLTINDESKLINNNVIREINNTVTTWQEQ